MNISTCEYKASQKQDICPKLIDDELCKLPSQFRCIEKIPVLSYSGMNNFMKCPRLYKLSNIDGWQLKWERMSDALKIGSWVDSKLTGSKCEIDDGDKNSIWMMKAQAMLKGVKNLSDFDIENYDCQHKVDVKLGGFGVTGYMDFISRDRVHFADLKCSARVSYYSNVYWVHDQMGTYFLDNDKLEYMYMFIAQTPMLKVNENPEEYRQRCYDDMCNRPDFYFHKLKFYRREFDLEGLKKRYVWLGGLLKSCIDSDYWYQDKTQCLGKWRCDMLGICDSGGVSKDLYVNRKVVNGG